MSNTKHNYNTRVQGIQFLKGCMASIADKVQVKVSKKIKAPTKGILMQISLTTFKPTAIA